MPHLDLTQVSSNWRKLQETLQPGKKGNAKENGLKRKRAQVNGQPVKAFKKTKLAEKTPREAPANVIMGQSVTKESAKLDALAHEHGIAKEDLSAAYGGMNGSMTRDDDEVNGGLHPTHKAVKYVALDCEMTGTGPPPHLDHVLSRVSMVNFHGEQIYDSYVMPPDGIEIEDYRTHVSGIKEEHVRPGYARSFAQVQKDASELLDGRILIGHALRNDLQVLMLSHPQRDIRDTFRHPKFRGENYGRPPSLRSLAEKELGIKIQIGEHSSVEDARATMMIFRKEKAGFEEDHRKRYGAQANAVPKRTKKTIVRDDVSEDEEEDVDNDDALESLDGEESNGPTGGDHPNSAHKSTNRPKKKSKKKKRTKRK